MSDYHKRIAEFKAACHPSWASQAMEMLDAIAVEMNQLQSACNQQMNEYATLQQRCEELEKQAGELYDIFSIGVDARTFSTLKANIENCKRFASYLHAVEREFLMVPGELDEDEPDFEPEPVCLVNCWGSTEEKYIEQFRSALQRLAALEAGREVVIGWVRRWSSGDWDFRPKHHPQPKDDHDTIKWEPLYTTPQPAPVQAVSTSRRDVLAELGLPTDELIHALNDEGHRLIGSKAAVEHFKRTSAPVQAVPDSWLREKIKLLRIDDLHTVEFSADRAAGWNAAIDTILAMRDRSLDSPEEATLAAAPSPSSSGGAQG